MNSAAEALAWVLEQYPMEGRLLYLRARPLESVKHQAVCVQTLRPHFDELQQEGYAATTEVEGGFNHCLVLGTPNKDETLANIARGFDHLLPGGRLLCSAPNDLGANSLEKSLARGSRDVVSFSKRKCRVFGCDKADIREEALKEWRPHGELRKSEVTGLWTRPGIFGWNKIDVGSRLLAETVPSDLKGVGADLGAGNGYLAQQVLEKNQSIDKLHLFEAEKLALEAAEKNVPERTIMHWKDVTTGLPEGQFDWVVMNPPFHQASKRNLDLGLHFVEQAARTLKRGASLWMVCNHNLPYEEPLSQLFLEHRRVVMKDGFKVLWGRK